MPLTKHHKGRVVHEEVRNDNYNAHANGQQHGHNAASKLQICCVPAGCSDDQIDPSEPLDSVKVVCNNEACTEGQWMHKYCFIEWERSVLSFLRSCGRARSWSEKQRLQNLWTKKGYDLAYKACDCKCGRGHLRKDLDYIPAPINDNAKKVKKTKKKNDKPMPVVSTNHKGGYNSNHHNQVDNHQHLDNHAHHADHANHKKDNGTMITTIANKRRGSDNTINNNTSNTTANTTSNTITSSPTITIIQNSKTTNGKSRSRCNSTTQNDSGIDTPEILDNAGHHPLSALFNQSVTINGGPLSLRLRTNSVSSIGSICSQGSSCGSNLGSSGSMSPLSMSPPNGNHFFKGKKEANDPLPMTAFKRRQDLSAFNALPRNKQNAYHIHIDDVQEDDETRNFVLSNLSNKRMTALRCVLCKDQLPVFSQFPLVDGTLFLSPQAYDQFVVQVIWEGRIQFLNSVCIACLQGASEAKCSSCKTNWDGSTFVVGTMYTYDIFAAMPCCQKRLTCKHCHCAIVDASMGLSYYSQYSHMIICPYCKANDFHFIRSLAGTFTLKESICNGI